MVILAQAAVAIQNPLGDEEAQLYLVVLDEPSVAEKVLEWTPGASLEERRRVLRSDRAEAHRVHLERQHSRIIKELGSAHPSLQAFQSLDAAQVASATSTLLNGFFIEATPQEASELQSHPSVQAVYPNRERWLLTDTVPGLVQAPAFWDALGGPQNAGAGIKIGIIDSGLNIDHPMLRDSSLQPPPGYPPPGSFADHSNNKVIVARNYVRAEYGLDPQANQTPQDERGHGSAVAAVAAGNFATAPLGQVQGVAPKAYLGNYKVFGEPGVNDTTTTRAILAALEDALQDGMDVINLSLGGGALDPATDPEQRFIKTLTQLGVVVVIAAGNSGPGSSTIQSPGTSPDAITVGATSHSRAFGSAVCPGGNPCLEVSSGASVPGTIQTIPYVPGEHTLLTSAFGPHPLVSISSLDQSEEACNQLPPNSLQGQIALVRRGSCLFSVKAENVVGAGAEAMVVYNNVEGQMVIMAFDDPPGIPTVMITIEDGLALRDFVQVNSAALTIWPLEAIPVQADILASFSSRGPSITQLIKPDLSAPGVSIYTASGTGDGYRLNVQGTSYSTPVVAGAAALVRQLHPDWPVAHIKSVLVHTASKTATVNGRPTKVNEAGNGRLDLSGALEAVAVVEPASLSLGLVTDHSATAFPQMMSLTNTSAISRTFSLQPVPGSQSTPAILVPSQSSVNLAPGQEVTLDGSVEVTGNSSGSFEGYLLITDNKGDSELTVSYWGVSAIEDGPRTLNVSQTPGASEFSSINEALAVALPGDTIEITDSAVYSDPVQISSNSDGVQLHGIILRSAEGKRPVIRVAPGEPFAVQATGVDGLTIEGLRIQGGDDGIRLVSSSGIVRQNILESDQEGGVSRITLSSSRAHIYGNNIESFLGNGITLSNSPALIQQNVIGGSVFGIGRHGIEAGPSSSSVPGPGNERQLSLFNNNISGVGGTENGHGIQLIHTPALIKETTVSSPGDSPSNGILANGSQTNVSLRQSLIRGHSLRGIWVNGDAHADLTGNRIQGNGLAGLWMTSAKVVAGSDRFLENGIGIRAQSASLELRDSVVASSTRNSSGTGGHGLSMTDSEAFVLNTTVFGNQGFGASWTGTTGRIVNSILHSNGFVALSDNGTNPHSFNLFDDHSLAGTDGNISGDPRLSAPQSFDFSLLEDSPAIDRGTHSVALSASDLDFQERIVDGNNDGLTQVDMGALEYSSHHSPALVLPVLSIATGDFVGLAMANAFSPVDLTGLSEQAGTEQSTTVTLKAYNKNGEAFGGSYETKIPAGQQISILLRDVFPALPDGWIEILPSHPDLMSFTLLGTSDLSFLDGAELTAASSNSLVFPEIRSQDGESTLIFLVNPSDEPSEVTLEWRGDSGAPGSLLQRTLPAKGMLSGAVTDLFSPAQCPDQTCSGGYIVVLSDTEISGLEIFGNENYKGGLQALDLDAASATLYAAQLASTGGIETVLNIINAGEASAVTVTARSETGQVIGTPVNLDLPANGQWRQPARAAFGFSSDQEGWIEVKSQSSEVMGNITFGDPGRRFLASLPLQTLGAREFLLSHVAQTAQIFTGITLLNPGPGTALVSVEVFDRDGTLNDIAFLEIAAGEKQASLLTELAPGTVGQSGGFVRIRSNQQVFGFEIFGSSSLEYFSAVPQQTVVH